MIQIMPKIFDFIIFDLDAKVINPFQLGKDLSIFIIIRIRVGRSPDSSTCPASDCFASYTICQHEYEEAIHVLIKKIFT